MIDPTDYTFELSPGKKTRYSAGTYDRDKMQPRYTIEISAPVHVKNLIEVKQFLLQNAGGFEWAYDIHNKSTWPAFIIIKKNDVLLDIFHNEINSPM
jgi:hypothetical protein